MNTVDRIRKILLETWDPLNVSTNPNLADEYDSVIAGIIDQIGKNRDANLLERYLAGVEEQLGVSGAADTRILTAERLLRLDEESLRRDELHDAILERISVDWTAQTCLVNIRGSSTRWQFYLKPFSDLRLPRKEPWGPSPSINSVLQSENYLQIEMQSGDLLFFMGRIEFRKTST